MREESLATAVTMYDHVVQEPIGIPCGNSLEKFGDASCKSRVGMPKTVLYGRR